MIRLLSTISIVALLAGTATAGDAPAKGPTYYKAPAAVSAVYDWRGVYAGLEGGYAWGNANGSIGPFGPFGPFGADFDTKGYLYGGKLGAQTHLGVSPVVIGLEAYINKTNIDGSGLVSNTGGLVSATADIKWLAGAHAKAGYAFNNFLPYATLGGACAQNTLTLSAPPGSITSSNYYSCGWSAGAGLDWAFMQNVILGVSYMHADLGNANPSFPVFAGVGVSVPSNRDLDIVKVSASLKF